MADFIQDGLRLSYGMGLKSALAGLWAGGGKGVIASPGICFFFMIYVKLIFIDDVLPLSSSMFSSFI